MNSRQCKELFYQLVYPSHPNEWEVEEIMDRLAELEDSEQRLLFSQVPVIWPISHSLCFSFLEFGGTEVVPHHLVSDWVRAILAGYETGGLIRARELICQAEQKFLQSFRDKSRVRLEDISARMTFYLRGLSGSSFNLASAGTAYTDTRTIFVPPSLEHFPQRRQNLLFYKLLITLHWGFIRQKTLRTGPDRAEMALLGARYGLTRKAAAAKSWPQCFALFPQPLLARDCFFLLEAVRVMQWIRGELPGLAEQVSGLYAEFAGEKTAEGSSSESAVGRFAASALLAKGSLTPELESAAGGPVFLPERWPAGPSPATLSRFYDHFDGPGSYQRPTLLKLLGGHDFEQATREIEKQRLETRDAFITKVAQLLEERQQDTAGSGGAIDPAGADASIIMLTEAAADNRQHDRMIIIDNEHCEIPEELLALVSEIEQDLGAVPRSYFSAASGSAGRGMSRSQAVESAAVEQAFEGELLFDEWDYRRAGYRKNWCRIYEKDLPEIRSNFVATTLMSHRGLLVRLKRQFEMMRVNEQFLRRQREGNDLDLDAIVEALADERAGVSPTDRLFVRLHRNERDIATLFLIDMSNSTEGWIGRVIKEALVLLSEAMEVVGDRYGIYGFSGMRRSRCEVFPIKRLTEPYSGLIRQRIGSMVPREYTRMGPAIRYCSDILRDCEARTRLLVTITDGKPEDYDDYKGDYAIEDTRKALQEARGRGLHAFCITIDKQAHDYLPHMFGAGNYIFVDDIQKLPFRMIDMYRLLTA